MLVFETIIQKPIPQLKVCNISWSELFFVFSHLKILVTLILERLIFKLKFSGRAPTSCWSWASVKPKESNASITSWGVAKPAAAIASVTSWGVAKPAASNASAMSWGVANPEASKVVLKFSAVSRLASSSAVVMSSGVA